MKRAWPLAALFLLALSAVGAEAPKLWGSAWQSASGSLDPASGSAEAGSCTSLSLSFEAGNSEADPAEASSSAKTDVEAAVKLSVLSGREAKLLWASLKAHPSRAFGSFTYPVFDAAAQAPQLLTVASIESLALRWSGGVFGAEAGMTTVNWGVGKAFSPADFFADIDYSEDKPRRLSRLLGRFSWFPSATDRVDFVVDPVGPDGTTLASRAYGQVGDAAACGMALGLRFPSGASPLLLGALDFSLDLPFASPYGEAVVKLPLDAPASPAFEAMGGFSTCLGDLVLMGEYLYSPDAMPAHSIFASASLPLDEWTALSLGLSLLPEFGAGSGSLGIELSGPANLTTSLSVSGLRSVAGLWTLVAGASARIDF